jgi:hypothetical protein
LAWFDTLPAWAAVAAELLDVSVEPLADVAVLDDVPVVGVVATAEADALVDGVDDVLDVAAMQPVNAKTPATLIAPVIRRARRAGCARRRRGLRTLVSMIPPRMLRTPRSCRAPVRGPWESGKSPARTLGKPCRAFCYGHPSWTSTAGCAS